MMFNGSAPDGASEASWVRIEEHGPHYRLQGTSRMQHAAAMGSDTHRQEAYYLFFVGAVGICLNILVVIMIFVRRTMRRLTCAFLVHACFLNLLKSAYCIPFGANLLSNAAPSDCNFQGSSYVVLITSSAFNTVAMICSEAYTFGETNVGGDTRGSVCCVLFGILMVYVCSLVLHLGPTLIGGYFDYNAEIGNCSFRLGHVTGYVAHVMWIIIVTLSLVGVAHFLCKLYKEIQVNQPNRVSMLVRSSITIMDDADAKRSSSSIRVMVKDASHRAMIFVITVLAFCLCWYPLFLLILIDMNFKVSPKVYQAFSFIAWSQGTIEPIIYICFDRHLSLLSRWVYCDRYRRYDASTLAYLMAQNRGDIPGGEDSLPNASGAAASATQNSVIYRDGLHSFPQLHHESDDSSGRRSPATESHSPGSTAVQEDLEPAYGNHPALHSRVSGHAAGSRSPTVDRTRPNEVQC